MHARSAMLARAQSTMGSGVRPKLVRTRAATELLKRVFDMTREALWASPQIADAELLMASRERLIAEALKCAGSDWTAEEETLLRRIAALDRELLERIHSRALARAAYR